MFNFSQPSCYYFFAETTQMPICFTRRLKVCRGLFEKFKVSGCVCVCVWKRKKKKNLFYKTLGGIFLCIFSSLYLILTICSRICMYVLIRKRIMWLCCLYLSPRFTYSKKFFLTFNKNEFCGSECEGCRCLSDYGWF